MEEELGVSPAQDWFHSTSPLYCTVVQHYFVQLYSTAVLCTVVQLYSVQLYSFTLYSCTAVLCLVVQKYSV